MIQNLQGFSTSQAFSFDDSFNIKTTFQALLQL